MHHKIKLVKTDPHIPDLVTDAVINEIKEGQKRALIELCLQKHRKLYESLSPKQQEKLKKQFPVLFQTSYWQQNLFDQVSISPSGIVAVPLWIIPGSAKNWMYKTIPFHLLGMINALVKIYFKKKLYPVILALIYNKTLRNYFLKYKLVSQMT
mgnify:CR=1 FL=1